MHFSQEPVRYDEAGDSTLYSRRGKPLVGSIGCLRFFILGFLEAGDRCSLQIELDSLRQQLLNDPYFANVPSFQLQNRKTAQLFHAKDDVPEV